MNFMKIIVDAISYLLQLMIVFQMFAIFGKSRKVNPFLFIPIYAFFVSISIVCAYFVKEQIWFTLLLVGIMFCLSYVYKTTLLKRLFAIATVSILIIIGEMLTALCASYLLKVTVEEICDNTLLYLITALIAKTIIFVLLKLIKSHIVYKEEKVPIVIFFPFIIMPIATFYFVYILSENVYNSSLPYAKVQVFISSTLLILLNFMVLFVFDYILKLEQKKRESHNKLVQADYEKRYYINLSEKQKQSSKTMHDLKNKLFAIERQLEKNTDDGIKSIKEICHKVSCAYNMRLTGNEATDALLNSKFEDITAKNIKLSHDIFVLEKIMIHPEDMCVILGNLIDNAIEACDKIPNDKERFIDINISVKKSYLLIFVSNSKCCKMSLRNKQFGHEHGFGLKNVSEIVKNYNGDIDFVANDNTYKTSVFLLNQ